MRDAIQELFIARSRLRNAQHWLAHARMIGAYPDIADYEAGVKLCLDNLWEAQLRLAAELIIDLGLEHAVVGGLRLSETYSWFFRGEAFHIPRFKPGMMIAGSVMRPDEYETGPGPRRKITKQRSKK